MFPRPSPLHLFRSLPILAIHMHLRLLPRLPRFSHWILRLPHIPHQPLNTNTDIMEVINLIAFDLFLSAIWGHVHVQQRLNGRHNHLLASCSASPAPAAIGPSCGHFFPLSELEFMDTHQSLQGRCEIEHAVADRRRPSVSATAASIARFASCRFDVPIYAGKESRKCYDHLADHEFGFEKVSKWKGNGLLDCWVPIRIYICIYGLSKC